jgi:hypothetical protein
MSDPIQADLRAHPADPPARVEAVRARLERVGRDRLLLRYEILGPAEAVVLPPTAAPLRADGLWETTCFELFLRAPGRPGYLEINVSPSGRWAAYDFCAYRAGMVQAAVLAPPCLSLRVEPRCIAADIELGLPLGEGPWRVGLCAIVEERDVGRSFWAVAHGAAEPDFHHPGCFAQDLPPPPRP